jgi:biopolymer transport protein ExbD
MSGGNLDKCEPNLVPMLDLVLQLVMFFMLVTNFIAEDLNADIKLPHALQARPVDKSEDYIITLNVDSKGRVLLGKVTEKEADDMEKNEKRDGTVLFNKIQVRNYMEGKKKADDTRVELSKKNPAKQNARISLVVLRAHAQVTFEKVNDILEACRTAGYADIQLRAVRGRPRS